MLTDPFPERVPERITERVTERVTASFVSHRQRRYLLAAAAFTFAVAVQGAARAEEPVQKSPPSWSADPAVVEKLSRSRPDFNYRESEVPDYELPDVFGPLGKPANAAGWPERRAAILELFRSHVYGHRPTIDAEISYERAEPPVDPTRGQARGQRVFCVVTKGDRTFKFPFYLYVPATATADKPVPLIIFINNRTPTDPEAMLETPNDFWPLDMIIEAGCAAAVFHTSDVDPDRADGYLEGIRGFLAEGQPRARDAWGALSAWGWGASRIADYAIENVPQTDPQRLAVVGHSRGGKAALWAAAEDPRFAISYSNNSGCGGAALSRRRFGETIARITSSFPHWFCEHLTTYAGSEPALPVDQHQLMALIAPRSAYVASAAEDLWADPRGEYLSLVHAAPVFELLGKPSIQTATMPPVDTQRVEGPTGYHIRSGGHNLTRDDWGRFLRFAAGRFSL
ncbi:glucuronyl esterase domain-containing protein [Candidatus Laterigemmans baculatus]|uniref:glucuronyl esterase domain-containing protein n=1 Tax=Candidatus Laterigemmans baculatus TaxID=2770505 RepID=UPI0013DC6203|nr:acetylxylan esterase [Candidatus Laterigemmans baculatus]